MPFFLEIDCHLRLLYDLCNALFGVGDCVVISSLTVYTRPPTAKGFWACFHWGSHSLGGAYLTSALPDNFALIVRGS